MYAEKFNLPSDPTRYIDKYFLRTKTVLEGEKLNPWVRAQVFIRKGPGRIYGIDEALAILEKYSPLVEHGGKVFALPEGAEYQPKDTYMIIESPIQDIIDLETMYLGVVAAETTKANDQQGVDLEEVTRRSTAVVKAANNRPCTYFGARHWRWDEDEAISRAVLKGGMTGASTDIGAACIGKKGSGTTPHVLENIMAWKYGYERAVPETMLAFDRHIETDVPRIILCDYRNKEIDDTITTARDLEKQGRTKLYGTRIDTCGENIGQGAINDEDAILYDTDFLKLSPRSKLYYAGHGVTISGTLAMRKRLDEENLAYVSIMLSSGFANPAKVKAFTEAEHYFKKRLYDGLGVGQLFHSRATKMDIVDVGEDPEHFVPISKTGRFYRPNQNLVLRLGGKR